MMPGSKGLNMMPTDFCRHQGSLAELLRKGREEDTADGERRGTDAEDKGADVGR